MYFAKHASQLVEKLTSVLKEARQTQTEINNDFFTVERSENGINFESIQITEGAGNSNNPLSYHFTDKHPLEGKSYYRLKQTDFDGNFTYSQTRTVTFNREGKFSVYPNPASPFSDINIQVPDNGSYVIFVVDATGRVVYSSEFEILNRNPIAINPSSMPLSTGIYNLVISGLPGTYSSRLVIAK